MTKLANKFLEFVDELQSKTVPAEEQFRMFCVARQLAYGTQTKLHDYLWQRGIL